MFKQKFSGFKEFYKSFLFRAWLSVVLVYSIIVLSVQLAYIYISDQYNDEWKTIYHQEVIPVLSELVIAGNYGTDGNPVYRVEALAKKYDQYISLHLLGPITPDKNILTTHTELFQMSAIKQNQLFYFTDKNDNLYLIEVKNPSHSMLYFGLSFEGFVIRGIPIFFFILFFTFFWARRFLLPVAEMIRASQQVGKGNLQQIAPESIQIATPEIRELCQNFNIMVQNLSKLQKSQQEMISDIAHELRSPLARQKLAINLLKERQFHKYDYKELLDRIENEGSRLNELIDEILNYLRPLQNHQLSLIDTGEEVYLTAMLESLIDDAAFEFSKQNKGIEFDLDFDNHMVVRGDFLKLERAIENIIRNALFHTKPYTKIMVTLKLDPATNEAIIEVKDHGNGVPEEHIPFLTKPFYRVDSARNKKDGGYGLGLTITNEIIKHHNGSISFENGAVDGLIVTIRLPLVED
ncbi:ATP-binding protein [Wohlfahrtiimonas chitiniclastica]|uniref:histidine kinase n=1 Tax=Wohlfahrtiimonas chitiniclastica TaxID=400946 RepID=A0A162VXM7_9GAMM|nr:ATP-binding protein [Wohlfahrtiimonas chitiniclastica]KZS23911.1 two-component sensor histidine kinase [Wohlfahrtiimonas chitiniclastica]MBS7816579.1 HAMP domain-containing protein [Wohlfahrtiimonas chitiniclastica]MBS7818279.1 HAMP domain-containing protein [Wohlfahrtiimonas chitiniclastica]MBS7822504.1 HAMP domain-containing protein [Wohlfahrtiimonas chitiniclastica]MBS7824650.1 HAMP domain-containing protein [Wohlfahrtiimonas chitiniclastica]